MLRYGALLLLILLPLAAKADVDPLTGTRISLASTQILLAAPALPSLIEREPQVGTQASYITESFDDSTLQESGSFNGGAISLNYSTREKGQFRYYGMVMGNSITGDVHIEGIGISLTDFKAKGFALAGGASYRLLGNSRSILAVGVFGGPAVMYFSSSFQVANVIYGSNPLIYGGYGGAQVRFHLGEFNVTPYGVRMQELSSDCKKMTSSAGTIAGPGCGGDPSSLSIPATFWAYGFVAGYRSLELNVYSKLSNDSSLKNLNVHNYTLSYTF